MTSPGNAFQRAPNAACGYPLKLEPTFVERVWGAPADSAAIASFFPAGPTQSRVAAQRIGEVWLTGDDSRIANGAHTGKTLGELARICGAALLDTRVSQHPSGQPVFPLLAKLLFTTDKLSVQVHPPDSVAARKGSWGKTEMWHILQAEPGAQLAIGFRNDLQESARTPQALREAAATGAIEEMLDWRDVHAGETFFVPAGTVQAIGAGLTICEIQQNSDITYRLYDYNRPSADGKPRALHLDEAMEVVEWQTAGGPTQPVALPAHGGARSLLAACPYFATERWECVQPLRSPHGGAEIWIVLEGQAELEASGERVSCSAGEVVIIPADATEFALRPMVPSVLLRTYQPDWENDITAPLRAAGASNEQIRRVAFPMATARQGAAR